MGCGPLWHTKALCFSFLAKSHYHIAYFIPLLNHSWVHAVLFQYSIYHYTNLYLRAFIGLFMNYTMFFYWEFNFWSYVKLWHYYLIGIILCADLCWRRTMGIQQTFYCSTASAWHMDLTNPICISILIRIAHHHHMVHVVHSCLSDTHFITTSSGR